MVKAGWEEEGKSVIERVFKRELELDSRHFIIEKAGEFDEHLSIFTKGGRLLASASRNSIEAYLKATTRAARVVAVERIVKDLEESL